MKRYRRRNPRRSRHTRVTVISDRTALLIVLCTVAGVGIILGFGGRGQSSETTDLGDASAAQASPTTSGPHPIVLGGPLDVLSNLPNATPVHGGYDYTAHGLTLQLSYDSDLGMDGDAHLTDIIIGPPGLGANWTSAQTPAVT